MTTNEQAGTTGSAAPRGWWRGALTEFLYPPQCVVCQIPCESHCGENLPTFCAECRRELDVPVANVCQRCSAPVGPHLDTEAGCIHCRSDRFAFAGAVSLGVYEGTLQSVCLQSKQPGGMSLAAALARLLAERHRDTFACWRPEVVIPVPHFWADRLYRGEPASATIAEELGKCLRIPVERHVLRKRRWTKRQQTLPGSERRRNLIAAFKIAGLARLDGARVLLADDILTTGTTASRSADVLRKAGAASVFVAVLARSTVST